MTSQTLSGLRSLMSFFKKKETSNSNSRNFEVTKIKILPSNQARKKPFLFCKFALYLYLPSFVKSIHFLKTFFFFLIYALNNAPLLGELMQCRFITSNIKEKL